MNEKVIGYLLLGLGLLAMTLPVVSVFLVLTKAADPINLFNFSGISLDLGQALPADLRTGDDFQTEVVSAAMLNQTANFFAHLFLMGFILNFGFRLASLGVQLFRPIKVEQKS